MKPEKDSHTSPILIPTQVIQKSVKCGLSLISGRVVQIIRFFQGSLWLQIHLYFNNLSKKEKVGDCLRD